MKKKQQRTKKLQRQQELVNTAKAAHRELTAEEQNEFDTLQREIETLNTEIAEEEQRQLGTPAPAATGTGNPAPAAAPAAPSGDEQQRAIQAERTRISEIGTMCRDFDMDPQRFIDDGSTVDQVRAAIIEHLRKESGPIGAGVHVTGSGEDDFRRDAAEGLILRSGMTLQDAHEGARQLSGMTLRDLAIECLERDNVTNARRMNSDELFSTIMQRQYFNPTAAFPTILDQAIEKSYVEGHRTVPVTFDQWTKKGSLKDFKVHDNNYIAGPVGEFEKVPEGGELKNDIPKDAKRPTRRIETYGKQFTLSRQAFINDDIDLVTRIPARYAAAARKTINTQCYKVLMNNPNIYDGKPLFGKDHGNILAKGTGITKEAVQAMIMALSTQKDEFDQAIIVRPAALIVPAGYAFDMYTLFFSPTINTEGNTQAVNPLYRYRDSIVPIEDPTINALAGGFGNVMPWWLTGVREDTDFIEVDYLNGQEIPTIRRMETAGQLGFVWDIYLDWGISVMDYRGAIKTPGVKIESPLG
jgi:hypothetical protein